jgi:hypothetical protein
MVQQVQQVETLSNTFSLISETLLIIARRLKSSMIDSSREHVLDQFQDRTGAV